MKYIGISVLAIVFIVSAALFFDLLEQKHLAAVNAIPIRGLVWVGEQVQNPAELVSMGANFVEVIVWAQVLDNSTVIVTTDSTAGPQPWSLQQLEDDTKMLKKNIRKRIQDSKKAGLKVYLVIYPERFNKPHRGPYVGKYNDDALLLQMRAIALHWARLAEEEGVELFSPANELFLFVGNEKTFRWHYELLPELRKIYHGSIAPRGFHAYMMNFNTWKYEESEDTQFNLSGFDYVAFDIYANHVKNFSEVHEYIRLTVSKALELKRKYGTKGIIFPEIGFPHAGNEGFWKEGYKLEDVKAATWEIFLNESIGKVDGFFFWDWKPGLAGRANPDNPNEDIWEEIGSKPTDVVKRYYMQQV